MTSGAAISTSSDHHLRLISDLCTIVVTLIVPTRTSRVQEPVREWAVTPGVIVALLLGASFVMMICGSATLLPGFMLMPWVIGFVMMICFAEFISFLGLIWRGMFNTTQKQLPGNDMLYKEIRGQFDHVVHLVDAQKESSEIRDIAPLQCHLMCVFGGDQSWYQVIRTCRKAYSVFIPLDLSYNEVFNEIEHWGQANNWLVMRPRSDGDSIFWKSRYRFRITISDEDYPDCFGSSEEEGGIIDRAKRKVFSGKHSKSLFKSQNMGSARSGDISALLETPSFMASPPLVHERRYASRLSEHYAVWKAPESSTWKGILGAGPKLSNIKRSNALAQAYLYKPNSMIQGVSDGLSQAQARVKRIDELVLTMPDRMIPKPNWDFNVLVKVLTETITNERDFITQMKNKWQVHPSTTIIAQQENLFLVHFSSLIELQRVLAKGVWSFRGDVLIMKRIYTKEQLTNPILNELDVWVQIHGIPPGLDDMEAVSFILRRVGTPISDPLTIHYMGHKAYKIRALIRVDKEVKDMIRVEDKEFGNFTVYFFYERVGRICTHCTKIGHTKARCSQRSDLLRFRVMDPKHKVPDLWAIEDAIGAWVYDLSLIPVYQQAGVYQADSEQQLKHQVDFLQQHQNLEVTGEEPIRGQQCFFQFQEMKRVADTDLMMTGENQLVMKPLNCKRAREGNPGPKPQ